MDKCLSGLDGLFCYMDDILLFSKTEEQHMKSLELLFERLKKYGTVIRDSNILLKKILKITDTHTAFKNI